MLVRRRGGQRSAVLSPPQKVVKVVLHVHGLIRKTVVLRWLCRLSEDVSL